ncbi:MAG: histidine phosphatase family protein [Candidatus Taylorbacteria bacterium]|nr:histidine phosphatase family protein [Candidatus Taylorbacteria bacterium]
MIKITFEAHSTSLDNESHVSSGHFDVELSPLGIQQSKEKGVRYANRSFDAIFCSDLQRSYKTAQIAFEGRDIEAFQDARLRECDYGEWTRKPSSEVEAERVNRIAEPFPKGESYIQTTARMKEFLKELLEDYKDVEGGAKILIIGHRATQYALDHLINKEPLKAAIVKPWKWQPGWTYYLKSI